MLQKERIDRPERNPDPITKAPGSHPVGTGIGAAAGGAAGIGAAVATGAVLGSAVGPVGTVAGAAIGAIAGGLIGKGAAEGLNPTVEEKYWRENYISRPYVKPGTAYDQYGPAYQYGWQARNQHTASKFDEVENELGRDWDRVKGKSTLKWEHAKEATRDAWNRIHADDE